VRLAPSAQASLHEQAPVSRDRGQAIK
jgi:hypothetical protein